MSELQWVEPALFVVIDYNLTRIEDVRVMTRYAKERYGLDTVLVRHAPGPRDCALADVVIDADPLAPEFVASAAATIRALGRPVVAALPFSDNAVQSGAALAETLGARADSSALADAAFSKTKYREREAAFRELFQTSGCRVPAFARIGSVEELDAFRRRCRDGVVLKPSCEGNNRGVLKLTAADDLAQAFAEVETYLAQGFIGEELIPYPEEYSFDGIGHLWFVTKKVSASGRYPVECGQTVNAALSSATIGAVARAGTLANLMCGQRSGPFHNEVKFDPATGMAAVVEPNRRPAGMSIWHLAGRVFGVNLFHLWVDQMVTGELPAQLVPRGSGSIRMLRAPCDGRMLAPKVSAGALESSLLTRMRAALRGRRGGEVELFDFHLAVAPGQNVCTIPRDNAGFVARISAFSEAGGDAVEAALDESERVWEDIAGELIAPTASARSVARGQSR